MTDVIGPFVWYVYLVLQFWIDFDSAGMSWKSPHVLIFAQRNTTILKSCLVASSLKEINPFLRLWCIFFRHPHLTSIFSCTAVWAQACGLERKTSFVIIVHLWFIWRLPSFAVVVGGNSITILLFLTLIFRTFAALTIFVECVFVNTLQYHDTDDFGQDPETEDPHGPIC